MGFEADVAQDEEAREIKIRNPFLFIRRRFKPMRPRINPLKRFLSRHSRFKNSIGRRQTTNSFEIINTIFKVVTELKLFDQSNHNVILCNAELQHLFEAPALHIDFLHLRCAKFLVRDVNEPIPSDEEIAKAREELRRISHVNSIPHRSAQQIILRNYHETCAAAEQSIAPPIPRPTPPRLIYQAFLASSKQTFVVRKRLQELLDPKCNSKLRKYPLYSERKIFALLERYLQERARIFSFDQRNLIYRIDDDPLIETFRCRAFHVDQIPALVHQHLFDPGRPSAEDTFSTIQNFYKNPNLPEIALVGLHSESSSPEQPPQTQPPPASPRTQRPTTRTTAREEEEEPPPPPPLIELCALTDDPTTYPIEISLVADEVLSESSVSEEEEEESLRSPIRHNNLQLLYTFESRTIEHFLLAHDSQPPFIEYVVPSSPREKTPSPPTHPPFHPRAPQRPTGGDAAAASSSPPPLVIDEAVIPDRSRRRRLPSFSSAFKSIYKLFFLKKNPQISYILFF